MKGKIPTVLFKAMAVVSALAMGGGYVVWRQSEAENANEQELAEQTKAGEVKDLELIIGTKNPSGSAITREQIDEILQNRNNFSQPIPGIPSGSKEVSNIVPLLPGSKSISMPLFTERHITKGLEIYDGYTVEVTPPPETEEKLPKLLPGSKSAIVIPVEPEKSE